MKKLLKTLLISLMAITTAFSLFACGDKEDKNNNVGGNESVGGSESIGGDSSGGGTEEASSPEKVRSLLSRATEIGGEALEKMNEINQSITNSLVNQAASVQRERRYGDKEEGTSVISARFVDDIEKAAIVNTITTIGLNGYSEGGLYTAMLDRLEEVEALITESGDEQSKIYVGENNGTYYKRSEDGLGYVIGSGISAEQFGGDKELIIAYTEQKIWTTGNVLSWYSDGTYKDVDPTYAEHFVSYEPEFNIQNSQNIAVDGNKLQSWVGDPADYQSNRRFTIVKTDTDTYIEFRPQAGVVENELIAPNQLSEEWFTYCNTIREMCMNFEITDWTAEQILSSDPYFVCKIPNEGSACQVKGYRNYLNDCAQFINNQQSYEKTNALPTSWMIDFNEENVFDIDHLDDDWLQAKRTWLIEFVYELPTVEEEKK